MLDKILNITPGSDYKNSRPAKGSREFFIAKNSGSVDIHDSLSISPAFLFLSQFNWNIHNLKLLKDEKLDISFQVNDIEFQTEIDLAALSKNYTFTYNLSQKRSYDRLERFSYVTLEIKFCNNFRNYPDYKGTAKLFERVWNLNFNNELNDEECYLNTLLEEIDVTVNAEIEFITFSLLRFIEKLLNKNIMSFFPQNSDSGVTLKIKKIKSVNA